MDEDEIETQHSVDIDGLTIGFDIIHLPAGSGDASCEVADIKSSHVSDPDEFMATNSWQERVKFYVDAVDWTIDNYAHLLIEEVT